MSGITWTSDKSYFVEECGFSWDDHQCELAAGHDGPHTCCCHEILSDEEEQR